MTADPLTRLVDSLRNTLDADGESDSSLLNRVRANRDRTAVEAIVRRHGPKVLAACRKVLGPSIDTDDAFQATFLVLLRNPSAIRRKESLGAWLYGVAHRIALQARKRRRRREQSVKDVAASGSDLSWVEACAILHEELDRLPDSLRLPLVLCYLDGRSRDEAAAQLGRTLPSVKKALERGREALRKRLTQRGVTLSAGLLAAVAERVAGDVPPELIRSAVGAIAHASAEVHALARFVLGNGVAWRTIGIYLAASILVVGVALGYSGEPKHDPPPKEPPRKLAADEESPNTKPPQEPLPVPKRGPATAKRPNDPLPESFTYQGRAVDLDGKPVKGARVFLCSVSLRPKPLAARATTDTDGRFRLEIKRSEFDAACYEHSATPWANGHLIAAAPGLGLAWTRDLSPDRDAELLFIRDDVPIEGRVVNLEGKPVAGAKVRTLWVFHPAGGDLSRWLENLKPLIRSTGLWKALDGLEGVERSDLHCLFAFRKIGFDPAIPPVSTGADGRFVVRGIGRERIALLQVEGPGIANQLAVAVTRQMTPITTVAFTLEGITGAAPALGQAPLKETVHGAQLQVVVGPDRPVTGLVTDVDTGKPVPGAVVSHAWSKYGVMDRYLARTTTGADGRFRLTGLPMRDDTILRVESPPGEPYIPVIIRQPAQPGAGPIQLNPKLKRGVWLTGKILDRDSKLPVRARVDYGALPDNPHLAPIKEFAYEWARFNRADDGTYRIAVLPGRGYFGVVVQPPESQKYERGQGTTAAPLDYIIRAVPSNFTRDECHALIDLDIPTGVSQFKQDVLLNAGRSAKVAFRGPGDTQLNGIVVQADPPETRTDRLDRDGTLLVRPRQYIQAVCPQQKLAGGLQLIGNEQTPVKFTLEPWRGVTGHVMDSDGKPVPDAVLMFDTEKPTGTDDEPMGFWFKGTPIRADRNGRFQIDGLVPGAKYCLLIWAKGKPGQELRFRADWKPGEIKDLGTIKTQEPGK